MLRPGIEFGHPMIWFRSGMGRRMRIKCSGFPGPKDELRLPGAGGSCL
jgi:hypothetical protein